MGFYYRTLSKGSRGRDVYWLQAALWWLCYYNGSLDGIFGTITENALKNFQSDNSLTVDGIYGVATNNVLEQIVGGYQTKLKYLGYYTGSIDIKVGPLTISATRRFQRDHRLLITGKITAATKNLLNDIQVNKPSRNLIRGERLFVSSDTVNATPTNIIGTITRSFSAVVVHYSASDDVSASTIRQWHLERGFSDIGYHFVIRRNGSIETGRNINVVGAHTKGHNNYTVGICLTGSNTHSWFPSSAQISSLRALIREIMNKQPKCKKVFLHRELNPTLCPGRLTKSQILG